MFIHLPPNAEHGITNTGCDVLIALTATSPASPTMEEWKASDS
jgi:quercetin dioxygenase-like cupin family protein